MDKGIDVSALTAKVRTYQQFLNFIRQPKSWIAIVVTIASAIICAWSFRYGLSRPFDPSISGIILAIGIVVTMDVIANIGVCNKTLEIRLTHTVMLLSTIIGIAIAYGTSPGFTTGFDAMITSSIIGLSAILGFLISVLIDLIVLGLIHKVWKERAKYNFSVILLLITFTVLFASSFQNVDARSWKFDRGTGKMVEDAVFIRPGSTLEREYNVVERKPQRKIFAYVWVPAIEDAIWSGDREPNSLRKEVVLTCTFKNYRAYQKIHGKLPEIFAMSPSRKDAPEDVGLALLRYTGLTSNDVEMTVDGLE